MEPRDRERDLQAPTEVGDGRTVVGTAGPRTGLHEIAMPQPDEPPVGPIAQPPGPRAGPRARAGDVPAHAAVRRRMGPANASETSAPPSAPMGERSQAPEDTSSATSETSRQATGEDALSRSIRQPRRTASPTSEHSARAGGWESGPGHHGTSRRPPRPRDDTAGATSAATTGPVDRHRERSVRALATTRSTVRRRSLSATRRRRSGETMGPTIGTRSAARAKPAPARFVRG